MFTYIRLQLNDSQLAFLDSLLATGHYGSTRPHVIQRLIDLAALEPDNPETLRQALRHIDSKAQASVVQLHNVQTQLAGLEVAWAKTQLFILELLRDPETQAHAEAIKKDYLYTRPEKQE